MKLHDGAPLVLAWLVLGLLAAAPQQGHRASASGDGNAPPEILFVQAPVVAAGKLPERFPQGSRMVRLRRGTNPKALVNITAEFFAVADPQVSFDGRKVLFAGQINPGARWQIWEMNTEGSGKRQLTRGEGDCLRPAYLPQDEIVFTAVRQEGSRYVSQLVVSRRDGSEAHPITFGPGDFQVETVLRNGLILASARSPLLAHAEAGSSRELYTLRPDGTGLTSFRCDHRQAAIRAQAEELDDGSLVFVKTRTGSEVGGELAQIPRGALHNSLIMPLRAASWSPRRLEAKKLIVARQGSATRGAPGKFDLYAFDFGRGQFAELIYEDSKLSSVQAVPVAAHPAPKGYWSTLNPQVKAGYFIDLNSYLAAGEPKGRLSTPIARVRVLTLEPLTNLERPLGEAPVEQDGSFYIAVPPDRPVRFELLDASGRVIRAQRSWIWTRAGEERGCVGCHEDKTLAPENRWPLTLRRFDTPTPLGIEAGAHAAH